LISDPLSVSRGAGLVLIGGDAATGAMRRELDHRPGRPRGNAAGVEINGNFISGPLTISSTTGTLPPPDTGSVHATGNTVRGPVRITTQRYAIRNLSAWVEPPGSSNTP
jgi:hypothetical protein